jgi:hypothetical protein
VVSRLPSPFSRATAIWTGAGRDADGANVPGDDDPAVRLGRHGLRRVVFPEAEVEGLPATVAEGGVEDPALVVGDNGEVLPGLGLEAVLTTTTRPSGRVAAVL